MGKYCNGSTLLYSQNLCKYVYSFSIAVDFGVLSSPYYSVGQYPPNSDCLWVIDVDPGQIVTFQFTAFDLESTEGCSADSVTIYRGSSIDPGTEMLS